MKKIFFAFIMLVFGLALKAQPPKGDANSGDTYGEKVNAENAIWVSELPTLLENKENITVLPIKPRFL